MPKKTFPIHPLFLALYPTLFIYSHNIGQIYFTSIFKPILITLLCTVAGWGFIRIFFKNWQKPAVITSLFLFMFFSYGFVRSLAYTSKTTIALGGLMAILFITAVFFISKAKKPFNKTTVLLNGICLVLIALPIGNIFIYHFTQDNQQKDDFSQKTSSTDCNAQNYPDVYFIVLDAYGRGDILKKIYNFDNSPLLNSLQDKGFYVAKKATSNYPQTSLSMASCLNMMYLNEMVKQIGEYNTSFEPARNLVKNNLVSKKLRKKGYTIVSFKPGTPPAELKNSDIYLNPEVSINQLSNQLKNITPIPDILGKKKVHSFDSYRKEVKYMFDTLEKIPDLTDKPTFVYAHLKIPHPPFIFKADGQTVNYESRFSDHDGNWLIRPGRLTKAQYVKRYTDQVTFVNNRLKQVITEILAKSKQPPVIIITADHGPRSELVWESIEKSNMKECMSIINCYYLPKNCRQQLYQKISLVNSFRVVFNCIFSENLELLEDKNYFSMPRYRHKFYDVSNRVQN